MSISERLKLLRGKHRLSQAQFAEIIEASPGNVATWELGKVLPSAKALINIAKKFKVSIDWLLLGNDNKPQNTDQDDITDFINGLSEEVKKELQTIIEFLEYRHKKEKGIQNESPPIMKHKKKTHHMEVAEELVRETDEVYLPLLGNSAAGRPILVNELLEGYVPVDKRFAMDKTFIVRAKGDSMIGMGINDGDFVVIRHQPMVDQGEAALVRIGDESTIKYFYRQGERILLKSANPKYKPIEIQPPKNISVIGKVVHVIKKAEGEVKLRET
ncbi:helix-turn-helix domain-containing protein [Desulfotruncus alcoholivorax]|uniref:helix-turn-helix domain-containing protein n=1 Tax=Desulfotruncus alcoholivorax TaxID=265477 RepID=UPI000424E0A1|nr:XRE family transcriptional regulator [Desulfotruncus alcoholivorax]